MGKQKRMSRKEKNEQFISKCAFGILFALCIQFLVYLVILNFVPTLVKNEAGNTVINPLYFLEEDYYGSSQYDNGTRIIYYYNMVLLVASIILIMYYFVNFMENNDGRMLKKIGKFLKEQWPFTILLVFMLWVFISSLLARDYYRSFVGCFNLKDGYLSFMMYGSMLICSLLMGAKNEKYRKIIVNTFLITATVVAILSLWNYHYLNSDKYTCDDNYLKDNRLYSGGSIITNPLRYYYNVIPSGDKYIYLDIDKYGRAVRQLDKTPDITGTAVTIGELLFGNGDLPLGENFLIVTSRIVGDGRSGIFHNSNHYGYYLSICVIVAAVMFIKKKNEYKEKKYNLKDIVLSLLYLASYIIILKMAIINNTLGAYLGIFASIIFMIIYAFMPKESKENEIKNYSIWSDYNYIKELICTLIVVAIFVTLSATTVNAAGENVVSRNFRVLYNDIQILLNNEKEEENETLETENVFSEISNSGETTSIVSGEASESFSESSNTASEEEKTVNEIGSGRGILWAKAWEMALQRPLFGYGLENIKYEYDEQFDINEGRSHNLILQLAATTGIVGMLLYVAGIASIWIRKLKYIKTWDMYECLGMFVIVSYIISSIVGNSSFYTSGYFYIFVGFVTLNLPKQEETTISKK